MNQGMFIGIVKDNKDPEKEHRVLVHLPTEKKDKDVDTYWCRVITPMAGENRGLVILPEIGTEVVLMFSGVSHHPYVIGAVYNGSDDLPEPYYNDDENNDKRVFWSRNDHMVIFDDTEGKEKVEIGAQTKTRLDITTAVIYQSADSSEKTITEYCDGDTEWEAVEKISIKCKDFELEASDKIEAKSSAGTAMKAGGNWTAKASGNNINKGSAIQVNSGVPASPTAALELPEYKHPPTKPE